MIEFENELKKSPLHFFTALVKDEVRTRSCAVPTAWYKQGRELIPITPTPQVLATSPPEFKAYIDLLKAMCLCMKCNRGPADEIVVVITEEAITSISWIRPKEVKTMRFRIFHEFGTHRPGDTEEVEDSRFNEFKEFLNLEGPCVIRG